MIRTFTQPTGAEIDGVFIPLEPRLARVFERLVSAQGEPVGFGDFWPQDRGKQINAKVAISHLRDRIRNTRYAIVADKQGRNGNGHYLLIRKPDDTDS